MKVSALIEEKLKEPGFRREWEDLLAHPERLTVQSGRGVVIQRWWILIPVAMILSVLAGMLVVWLLR